MQVATPKPARRRRLPPTAAPPPPGVDSARMIRRTAPKPAAPLRRPALFGVRAPRDVPFFLCARGSVCSSPPRRFSSLRWLSQDCGGRAGLSKPVPPEQPVHAAPRGSRRARCIGRPPARARRRLRRGASGVRRCHPRDDRADAPSRSRPLPREARRSVPGHRRLSRLRHGAPRCARCRSDSAIASRVSRSQVGIGGPSAQSVKERDESTGAGASGSFSLGTDGGGRRARSRSTGERSARVRRAGAQLRLLRFAGAHRGRGGQLAATHGHGLDGRSVLHAPALLRRRRGVNTELGYTVGATIRYASSSHDTFITEFGYSGVGDVRLELVAQRSARLRGHRGALPARQVGTNQLLLGVGPGFEHYSVSGTQGRHRASSRAAVASASATSSDPPSGSSSSSTAAPLLQAHGRSRRPDARPGRRLASARHRLLTSSGGRSVRRRRRAIVVRHVG